MYFQEAETGPHENTDQMPTLSFTKHISGQTQRNIKAPRKVPAHESVTAQFKPSVTASCFPFQQSAPL